MGTRLIWVLRTYVARVVIWVFVLAILSYPYYLIGQSKKPAGRPGVFTVHSCTLITDDHYLCDGDFHPDQGSLPFLTIPMLDSKAFYTGGTRLPAYLRAHGEVQESSSDGSQSRTWQRVVYGAVVGLILGSRSWIMRLRRRRVPMPATRDLT